MTGWLDRAGGIDGAMAELSQSLGIDADETIESVERELFDASLISAAEWPALIAILAKGAKTDRDQADRLTAMRTATGPDRYRGAALGLLHRRGQCQGEHRHQEPARPQSRPLRPLCRASRSASARCSIAAAPSSPAPAPARC